LDKLDESDIKYLLLHIEFRIPIICRCWIKEM